MEYKKAIMSIQHGIVIHEFSTCEDDHVHVKIEYQSEWIDAVIDIKDFCNFLLEKANLRKIEFPSLKS